jgi:uncharacterized protein (DUF2252 family)
VFRKKKREEGEQTMGLLKSASLEEARAFGRGLRKNAPRSSVGTFTPGQRDPLGIIEEQNRTRLPDLVPVRIGRMLESPFAYFRGTAGPMAADLANESRSGFLVIGCGDAHIGNFGLFGSPDRKILFDMNDFDEAGACPWEWDVKRMAASVVLACRDAGIGEQDARLATEASVRSYRDMTANLQEMSAIERYYVRLDSETLIAAASTKKGRKMLEKGVEKASRRTSQRVLSKITTESSTGEPRIVPDPPILQRVDGFEELITEAYGRYLHTLPPDRATLLSQYRLVDMALRVVGVGSVGTRCLILLLLGPDDSPLFLQIKEATASVLETYGRIAPRPIRGLGEEDGATPGYRVVSGQEVLQAASDPFLGWTRGRTGELFFYVRQFKDMKGSADLPGMDAEQYVGYGTLCGAMLARGHSQSPGSAAIAGYLGKSDRFDRAVTEWSVAYADQMESDFEAFGKAVEQGRFPVETGV